MPIKLFSKRPPSIETVSTGLTYVALTGLVLAPLATARPVLPPAVEAKAQTAAPATLAVTASAPIETSSRFTTTTETRAVAADAQAARAATAETQLAIAEARSRELTALPPPRLLAEAKSRLKSVRAKDGKLDDAPMVAAAQHVDAAVEPQAATVEAVPQPPPVKLAKAESVRAKTESKADKSETKPATPPAANAKLPAPDAIPVDANAPPTVWTDAEIAAALKECLRLLAPVNAEIEVNPAVRKGECGTPAPIRLRSIGTQPKVTFQPAVEINCPMAVALGEWAKDTLQPAARDAYGSDVTQIVNASGYSCRNRYGSATEKLSEHALANAIDIGGFTLANGTTVKVTAGWGSTKRDIAATAKANDQAAKDSAAQKSDDKTSKTPAIKSGTTPTHAAVKTGDTKNKKEIPIPANVAPVKISETAGTSTTDGKFLRRLHEGACDTFGTVLGPEANEAHRDHFHFDLKARKRRAVCQ